MTQTDALHILLLPLPAWGHVRPLCVLAGRLVSESSNVVVTLLIAPNWLEMARSEVCRQFSSGEEALRRIRIVSMFKSSEKEIFKLTKPFEESFPAAYKTLSQAKPITCATTGTTFDSSPAPIAVIMDFFAVPQLRATREISGNSVPVIAWVTGGASTIIRLFGPEERGGLGNFGAKICAEAARTRKCPEDISEQIFRRTTGEVIRIRGLPPMYDYELFPQKLLFEAPISPIIMGGYQFLTQCDGAIISTAEAYEKESLEELQSYFSDDLSKPLYALGPLLPPGYGSGTPFSHLGDCNAETRAFLDEAYVKHGEKSTLFMSFGTLFWPATEEYVVEVIEALLEKEFPFILCHASPFAKISHELSEKVQNSGIGMLTAWSPQQTILNHPATGWFLTHCGHGGLMESLSSGIPMICWPFDLDQPAAAKHLSQNLNVAFELIEVKTGLGLEPLYGTGYKPQGTRQAVGIEIRRIIDEARGEIGKEKRRNATEMQKELRKAWREDGVGRHAMRELLKMCMRGVC